MKTFYKILLRLIALPFWAALVLISFLFQWGKNCVYFILHGGEAIAYARKDSSKTISEVYSKIEKQYES